MNAKEIKLKNDSSDFVCELENKKVNITVPVGGEHFILNALCAVSVGKILKIEPEKIVEGIEGFELTKKRMDITELANGIKIINDAYNASLESMQASLNYLAEFKNNRKIAQKNFAKQKRERKRIQDNYNILEIQHRQDVQELSESSRLSNESYRKWNYSAYKYNPSKKRYEFDNNLGRSYNVPKYIKER